MNITPESSSVVAQVSKPAVSPVSKPAGRGFSTVGPGIISPGFSGGHLRPVSAGHEVSGAFWNIMEPASWLVAGLTMAIRAWQLVVSPAQVFLFGATGGCRYTPSCSAYALEALRGHGAMAGTALTARRICRCHPWGGGGHDPVPPARI